MSFNAIIKGQGNFTASVNDSAVFNVSVDDSPTLNVTMAAIGPSGLLTADAPLIYDGVLKNLSIDLSDYATLAYANGTFYPLTNPAGYITNAALSGYATESWVTGQGYITSAALAPYLLSSTAAETYQPIGDYATNTALTSGLALKLDKPTVGPLDTQILAYDSVLGNVWIDNYARSLFAVVRNETGATLPKGTIVYISGASGNKPLVQKAIASTEEGSSKTFAVLAQDIAHNNNGNAITFGELAKLDTFGLPEGAALWLSPTVAGAWTTTKPTAPNHSVFIGNVIRAHQNQGVVEVRIQNGYELDELHDVAVLDRADKDVLVYESATSLWKGKTVAEILGYTPADNASLANYLTISSAAATYYPLTNPTGYITASALSPYLLSATAATTYQPIGDYATNTALTGGLATKANVVHTHDASAIVSGTIDLARIPVIPSQIQVVSTQASITNLTPEEQAQITGAGVLVTTTDGRRWVYNGSGSKTDQANYVELADITPDWSVITNKPAFGTAALANTGDFAPAGWNPFNQSLNTTDVVGFQRIEQSGGIIIDDTGAGGGRIEILATGLNLYNGVGIKFSDGTGQDTAGISPATAASTYYPLTNPSGYITSSALSGYATESWVASQGYLTAPYNPFNQSLNTNDFVRFIGIHATDNGGEFPHSSLFGAWSYGQGRGFYVDTQGDGNFVNSSSVGIKISPEWITFPLGVSSGIMFADGSSQQTAAVSYDQSLNTTDLVSFSGVISTAGITILGEDTMLALTGDGITFPDSTVQTTAATTPDLTPYAEKAVTNTFTASQVIEVTDNSNAALRVTQLGTGDAFRVEDSTNPDSSPFVINADGNIGIGRSPTSRKVEVSGNFAITGQTVLSSTAGAITALLVDSPATNSADCVRITNLGSGNSFVVEDSTNPDSTPFVIDANGNVGVGRQPTAGYKFDVAGQVVVAAGNTSNLFTSSGTIITATSTAIGLTINNTGTGNSFRVNDEASDTTPFIVDAGGNVGVKTASPAYDLDVNGTANITTLRFADGTTMNTAAVSGGVNATYTSTESGYEGLSVEVGTELSTFPYGLFINNSTSGINTSIGEGFYASYNPYEGDYVNIGTNFIEIGNYDGYTNRVVSINPETGYSHSRGDDGYCNLDGFGLTIDYPPYGEALSISPIYFQMGGGVNTITIGLEDGLNLGSAGVSAGGISAFSGGVLVNEVRFEGDEFLTAQTHAYPFSGAVASAIEGGLLNANSPSSDNAFATLGDVESSVNAYAASVLPVLPTQDEKDAMANANTPSASNPFLTVPALPVASTSQLGVSQFASMSEATSDFTNTKSVTPFTAVFASIGYGVKNALQFGGAIASGTGATTATVSEWGFLVTAPNAGIVGHAMRISSSLTTSAIHRGVGQSQINWTKPIVITGNFKNTNPLDVNNECRFSVGKAPTGTPVGPLTQRGFGFCFFGDGELMLEVHNGTTPTQVGTGITIPLSTSVSVNPARDFALFSRGDGYVELYIDDILVASTNNGPTGTGTFYNNGIVGEIRSLAGTTVSLGRVAFGSISAFFGPKSIV
jgi:hypothetical protein